MMTASARSLIIEQVTLEDRRTVRVPRDMVSLILEGATAERDTWTTAEPPSCPRPDDRPLLP